MQSFERWKLTVCFFLERRSTRPRGAAFGHREIEGGDEKIVDAGLRVDCKVMQSWSCGKVECRTGNRSAECRTEMRVSNRSSSRSREAAAQGAEPER